jgi:hypothetical protein
MKKLTVKDLIQDFGSYFNKYGITQKQLRKEYDKQQSVADYAWTILQKILDEASQQLKANNISLKDFYDTTASTYKQMAYLLKLQSKDSRGVQRLAFEHEVKLIELAYSNLLGVKVFSYGCCDGCQPFHNMILSVEEALAFAKKTEVRCNPRHDNFCRTILIPEMKPDESTPIKLSVSFG